MGLARISHTPPSDVARALVPAVSRFISTLLRGSDKVPQQKRRHGRQECPMPHIFPMTEHLHGLWGGRPRPQPAPWPAFRAGNHLILRPKSGSRGTRADQGVCPTNSAAFQVLGKLCGIGHSCLPCRDFRFADPCRASRHVFQRGFQRGEEVDSDRDSGFPVRVQQGAHFLEEAPRRIHRSQRLFCIRFARRIQVAEDHGVVR